MKSATPKPTAQKQSLAVSQADKVSVSYKDIDGNPVELTSYIINNFLAPGCDFTAKECWTILGLCKARGLNPTSRDCYIQRYNGIPQIIISRDYYQKRACKNLNYRGKQNGIAVINKAGVYEEREGTILLPGEELVGAWCKVYMKNLDFPIKETVSFSEVAKTNKDGQLQSTWKTMPATMCEKVAVVKALKAAMTEEFGGTYSADELGFDEDKLSSEVKDVTEEKPEQPKPRARKQNIQEAQFTETEAETEEPEEEIEDDFDEMQRAFFN